MPVTRLKKFLDEHDVRYETIRHTPAYTACDTARAAHIPGRDLAKVVLLQVDGKMAMAVLPATEKLDVKRLKALAGAADVRLAAEEEFKDKFPACELGAMPPFGNLYGMEVFAADSLAADERIAFNAGSHSELIRMTYRDFERLVQPKIGPLALEA
jgi:Ala-tRNA(Pro) deacylase